MNFLLRLISCFFLQALINSSLYASDDQLLAILKTYNDNQARFHLNHKGKIFKGEGFVQEVRADLMGTGRYFMVDVDLNVSRKDRKKIRCVVEDVRLAASLNQFDSVDISGVIDDVALNVLILKDCNFDSNYDRLREERLSWQASRVFECHDRLIKDPVFGLQMCGISISDVGRNQVLAACKLDSPCILKGNYVTQGESIWVKVIGVQKGRVTGQVGKSILTQVK